MRDPLHFLSVRYKLVAMFAGVSLLFFGVGGYFVSKSVTGALESEILGRLEFQSRAYSSGLDSVLRLLMRRTEDFASDGHIRRCLEEVSSAPPGEERAAAAAELSRHLRVNKLPLVPAFGGLVIADAAGDVVLAVPEGDTAEAAAVAREGDPETDGVRCGGLVPPGGAIEYPSLFIRVPLLDLSGGERIGSLLSRVNVAEWIAEGLRDVDAADLGEGTSVGLRLLDASGRVLRVPPSQAAGNGPRSGSEVVASGFGFRVEEPAGAAETRLPSSQHPSRFARSFPIESNGWRVIVEVAADRALQPLAFLLGRLLLLAVALALGASLLLYFPMRFLARPLIRLRDAALRVKDGRFDARVAVETSDELGELSVSFNGMAEALGERTRRLEAAAEDLRAHGRDLRSERDRLDAVIRSMRDGLAVLDPDGRVVVANEAGAPLARLLERRGARAASLRVCADSSHAGGDCGACLVDPSGPPRNCLVDVDGSVFEVSATSLMPDESGRSGRVLVARDITDRVSQDERQIHQERLAVLGEVAAVMAHELNNPLAAISMFNQMLSSDLPPDSPFRENVELIRRNTETCKRVIRELLDYATGARAEIAPIDVHETIRDVARFLTPLARRAVVEIALDLAARDAVVTGDEIQIRQVFVNLIMNSIQAMGSGGGRVAVATESDGDELAIRVTDSGPGVAPEVRARIFHPFFTTKRRGSGTGLGLTTARRIAEMHGGGLDLLESGPGGTTFRVRLILRRRDAAAEARR